MKLHFSPDEGTDLDAAYSVLQRQMQDALYRGVPEAERPRDDFSTSKCAYHIVLTSPSVEGDKVVFRNGRTLPLKEIVEMAAREGLEVTVDLDMISIP